MTGQGPPLRSKRVAAPGRAISGPLQESGSHWAPRPAASDALRSLPAPTATAPRQDEAVSLHRGTGGSKGPKPWRTADRREPLPLGTARARAAFGEMLSHVGERGGPRKDGPPSCSGLRLFTAPLCTCAPPQPPTSLSSPHCWEGGDCLHPPPTAVSKAASEQRQSAFLSPSIPASALTKK